MRFATEKEVTKILQITTSKDVMLRHSFIIAVSGMLFLLVGFFLPIMNYLFAAVASYVLVTVYMNMSATPRNNFEKNYYGEDGADAAKNLSVDNRSKIKAVVLFPLITPVFVLTLYYFVVPMSTQTALSFMIGLAAARYGLQAFISYCNKITIPEYPSDFREKTLVWLWRNLQSGTGYYIIGEVNGKLIGLPRALRFLHTLIIGPTGEEKTSSHFLPQLLADAYSPGSAVDIDAKSPSHFNAVAGRWVEAGKRVFLFDPWHSDTVAINPLPDADDEDLLVMVEVLTKDREEVMKPDPFFHSRTRYLLFSVLKLVQSWKNEYCNLASVFNAVQSYRVLDALVMAAPEDIKLLFTDHNKLGPESKINALTSLRDKLDIFMDPSVRKAFSRPDFKLNMLFEPNKPCLLIIGANVDKEPQSLKIASLLANLISNLAFKERRLRKLSQQEGTFMNEAPDLYMYLDELRKLKIIRLPDLVSIARETRMHIIGSVTDLGFFRYYGQDFAALMSNFRTKIVLGGLDNDSALYISKTLGGKNTPEYMPARGATVVKTTHKDLLEAAEVNQIPKTKVIIIPPITELKPFPASKVSIYRTKWVKKMLREKPENIKDKYMEWGIPIEPLDDPVLPMIEEGLYDFSAIIDHNKSVRVDFRFIEQHFVEEGGGRYVAVDNSDAVFSDTSHARDDSADVIAVI